MAMAIHFITLTPSLKPLFAKSPHPKTYLSLVNVQGYKFRATSVPQIVKVVHNSKSFQSGSCSLMHLESLAIEV